MMYLFGVVVDDTAYGTGSLGFDSGAGQIGRSYQRLAAAATFLRSCVAQTRSRGDGRRHWLHASVQCHEYNEELIFFAI